MQAGVIATAVIFVRGAARESEPSAHPRGGWIKAIAIGAIGVGAFLLASVSTQAAPKLGERIAITACPHRGVVATCLMINNYADGTVFNISSANPRPRPMGHAICLRGTITDKASTCGQGVVLDRIRWTRVPRRCPG
jgi:hypothetical protein